MDIIHSIDDGLFKANTLEDLQKQIIDFYSYNGAKPEVYIKDGFVYVHIDTNRLQKTDALFQEAMDACNKGEFPKANKLLQDVLKECPEHPDAHRVLAQILMNQGKLNEALDKNIDALKADPRNIYALILMGNIFMRLGDKDTARNYYKKILEIDPDNVIGLTNMAANHMERKEFDEAIPMFQKVIAKDPSYINPYYGLALAFYHRNKAGDVLSAFNIIREGLIKSCERPENPQTRSEAVKLIISIANDLAKEDYQYLIEALIDIIQLSDKTEIRFKKDSSLNTAAKLIYGPSHGKHHHGVLYNPKYPYSDHLKMHELTHLDMMVEANKKGENKIIYSTTDQRSAFRKKFGPFMNKFQKQLGRDEFAKMMDELCINLALQVLNCPLDMIVEDRLFNNFTPIRPLQLLSLLDQQKRNIEAVQKAGGSGFFPPTIVRANKIMNIVTAMHLKKLYGIDFINQYRPTKAELDMAKDLFEEYEAYQDYTPGEEYDLCLYYAESLGLDEYITFSPEGEFDSGGYNEDDYKFLDDLMEAQSVQYTEEQKERQRSFEENHSKPDEMRDMMMSMFMLGALEYFEAWTTEEIKRTAMEIALLGTKGFSPEKKSGYSVPSIPGKDFGGYQMLAYYYVSWELAIPEMRPKLGLNMFDNAYKIAKQLYEAKKGE